MKKEYKIKEKVWIHLGERKLVEGRVVDVIDLEHLEEGHSPDRELYIIEVKTGIEDVYEVRTYEQISPDAKGPINLFRNLKGVAQNNRLLKKVGMQVPLPEQGLLDVIKEIEGEFEDLEEPTDEQIHAALDLVAQGPTTIFKPEQKKSAVKKRKPFVKRKKNDSSANT